MGWPKELEDKIVEKAEYWLDEALGSRLTGTHLKRFFVDTGAVKADVPEKPFKIAVDTKKQPVLGSRPISWCGIFATFIYRDAGLSDVIWRLGVGPRSRYLRRVAGHEGIGRGDLGIVLGKRIKIRTETKVPLPGLFGGPSVMLKVPTEKEVWSNHHFIVIEDIGDSVKTIDGNMGWPTVIAESTHEKKSIVCYYTYKPHEPP